MLSRHTVFAKESTAATYVLGRHRREAAETSWMWAIPAAAPGSGRHAMGRRVEQLVSLQASRVSRVDPVSNRCTLRTVNVFCASLDCSIISAPDSQADPDRPGLGAPLSVCEVT